MNTVWHELKEKIYFEDGSLRDIYAFDINLRDWEKWVAFVNQNYQVEFLDKETEQTKSAIDFSAVKRFWSGESEFVKRATIKIDEININCHFFVQDEFENDIFPKEINSLDSHKKLVDYLSKVSRIFNRKILLTEENSPQFALLEILDTKISMNL